MMSSAQPSRVMWGLLARGALCVSMRGASVSTHGLGLDASVSDLVLLSFSKLSQKLQNLHLMGMSKLSPFSSPFSD